MLVELNKYLFCYIGKGWLYKLLLEDCLFLCIEYWREYWIFFYFGMSYGVFEMSVICIICVIEDILICFGKFNLLK